MDGTEREKYEALSNGKCPNGGCGNCLLKATDCFYMNVDAIKRIGKRGLENIDSDFSKK